MNVDSISTLISSCDVSSFRTVSLLFLDLIGFSSVHLCDGPYDGGKDFKLYEDNKKSIKLGIQISIEKAWKAKIKKDANKVKNNYSIDKLIFISSRRIPENSFAKIANETLLETGVSVTRYDNQAISSEFIKSNRIEELLSIIGINLPGIKAKSKYTPKHEAISSVILFGEETKKFRDVIFDNLIKSYLSVYPDGIERDKLIDLIISDASLSDNQAKYVNSHIDRLLQQGLLEKKENLFTLKDNELNKFLGLRKSGEQDYIEAQKVIRDLFRAKAISLNEDEINLIFENITDLIVNIYASQISYLEREVLNSESYQVIKTILSRKVGNGNIDSLFSDISEAISETAFGVRISSTALYLALLNADSEHLLEAMGGKSGAYIYLDSSVVIPMLCGLLFETTSSSYRFGYSANLLYKLIKDHRFTALVPEDYIEEVAAHLIEACRDYVHIIDSDIDLSFSTNAFVSHYSRYKDKFKTKALSFDEYADIFGVSLRNISHDMSNSLFYRCRDVSKQQITDLLSKYGIDTVPSEQRQSNRIKEDLERLLFEHKIQKSDVLIRHDASVICYLSSAQVSSGIVKILCTWDKIHSLFKSNFNYGYDVLTPISIIDMFSLAKPSGNKRKLTVLVDFAMAQSTKAMAQGARIWDEIVKIEKESLSDAHLIMKARKFKKHFVDQTKDFNELEIDDIATAWDAWKNK